MVNLVNKSNPVLREELDAEIAQVRSRYFFSLTRLLDKKLDCTTEA